MRLCTHAGVRFTKTEKELQLLVEQLNAQYLLISSFIVLSQEAVSKTIQDRKYKTIWTFVEAFNQLLLPPVKNYAQQSRHGAYARSNKRKTFGCWVNVGDGKVLSLRGRHTLQTAVKGRGGISKCLVVTIGQYITSDDWYSQLAVHLRTRILRKIGFRAIYVSVPQGPIHPDINSCSMIPNCCLLCFIHAMHSDYKHTTRLVCKV